MSLKSEQYLFIEQELRHGAINPETDINGMKGSKL